MNEERGQRQHGPVSKWFFVIMAPLIVAEKIANTAKNIKRKITGKK